MSCCSSIEALFSKPQNCEHRPSWVQCKPHSLRPPHFLTLSTHLNAQKQGLSSRFKLQRHREPLRLLTRVCLLTHRSFNLDTTELWASAYLTSTRCRLRSETSSCSCCCCSPVLHVCHKAPPFRWRPRRARCAAGQSAACKAWEGLHMVWGVVAIHNNSNSTLFVALTSRLCNSHDSRRAPHQTLHCFPIPQS